MQDNLQRKSISVRTEMILNENFQTKLKLLNITLLEEESHIYLELADFSGEPSNRI
jgi:hypothetical protein